MRMHSLCKSISVTTSSSGVFPITSNAYIACRSVGFQRFLSSYRDFHTLPAFCKFGDVSFRLSPLRLGFDPFLNWKVSAVAHPSFISTRGLKCAPKKNTLRNPCPSSNSSLNPKKGKVNASKDSSASSKDSLKAVQAHKSNFSKPKQAETRSSLKPVQAQNKISFVSVKEKAEFPSNSSQAKTRSAVKSVQANSSSRTVREKADFSSNSSQAKTRSAVKPVQAKAKGSSKQVQKKFVVDELEDSEIDDEFDEDLDDDEEDLDNDDLDDEDFDEEEDEALDDEFVEDEDADDEEVVDEDDAFIDDMLDEEGEGVEDIMLGDGGDGGGVKLSGQTGWGEKALSIAKGVLEEFGDNFSLYAFKTSFENRVYVRLDKHSDRYGSPSMVEIESFSSIYGKRLEEAGQAGSVPDNIALEVSSPGAERVVQVPDQLMRFKDLPMLVRYEEIKEIADKKTSPVVKDSILQLASVETELGNSVWKLANVRANREQAGKGRSLTKKQKEWKVELPLSSLRLVRLYMDV